MPVPDAQTQQYHALLQAVMANPSADNFYRLGCFSHDMKKWGSAAICFARVIEERPENFRALCNYGWNLHLSCRTREGMEYMDRALELAPDEGTALALRAQMRMVLGDDEGAVLDGGRAADVEPNVPVSHLGYAFALLNAGNYIEGWKENEHRFQYTIPEVLTRPYRLWRGEYVDELYIEQEQGSGDCIFALRWVPEAARRVGHVVLYVPRELYGLILDWGNLPKNVTVYPLPRALPVAEAFCPMMSLPAALELDEAEAVGAYLGKWVKPAEKRTFDVGICFQGNTAHANSHHRDCALAYWMMLGEIPKVRLHSLQVGEGQAQLGELAAFGVVRDRSPEITNFLDTARIIQGLDLVISVDTSVAHLAGAMGAPCWLLLNQMGRDWRWSSEGEESRWYKSQRIFRRSVDELTWEPLMRRVRSELEKWVSK